VDLSPVLRTNNPSKVAYINFTDGTTSDGWGPGVFWMAAYSGTLDIESDGPVFTGLQAINGDPEGNFGVNVVRRQYDLDPSKSLQEIILPSTPATGSRPYLLAATLIPGAPVSDVSLTASLTATGELMLSWPASATGYSLESTTNFSQWGAVSGTPQASGDQLTLTVPTSGTASFYRLKK
jgi:hypothetical protein